MSQNIAHSGMLAGGPTQTSREDIHGATVMNLICPGSKFSTYDGHDARYGAD